MGIFTLYSRPEPNPALEAKVREQLQQIDSLLDIKWMPYGYFNKAENTFEGRYCLANHWPQGDERWQLYQSGEIQEHWDMIGWFCIDISDPQSVPVDIDSIWSKVVELLGKCDNSRHHWRDRMKEMVEKNNKLRQNRKQLLIDQAAEVAHVLGHAVGRHEESTIKRMMDEVAQGKI